MADDELLTVKQVARELGLANTKVMSLIRRGHVTALPRPAGSATWRVSREALDAYLGEARAASTRAEVRQHEKQLKRRGRSSAAFRRLPAPADGG